MPIPWLAKASLWSGRVARVISLKCAFGRRRLIFRCYSGNLEIVQILIDASDDPSPGLLPALWERHSQIVRLLLASGATCGPEHAKALEFLPAAERTEMGLL